MINTTLNLKQAVLKIKKKKKHLEKTINIYTLPECKMTAKTMWSGGQENITDVHYTVHFHHPFPSTLFFPHSCGGVTCQEDNTMTESEVRGVRGQRGTTVWG